MAKLDRISGTLIPFNRSNIDTDAILPKQYLKRLDKTGYGAFLFDDERYLDPGDSETPVSKRRENERFILNLEPYKTGAILVSRKNFGCGSSREHAVWAIRDFGIRVVIAESFGEIFFNNCVKNGVLPIILREADVALLIDIGTSSPATVVDIDLASTSISFGTHQLSFVIDKKHKTSLAEGRDAIAQTLELEEQIRAYELERRQSEPWVFA